MSQFASTLYPQTNPSNPILLEIRKVGWMSQPLYIWQRTLIRSWYRPDEASDAQIAHARRVIERLASLAG